MRKREAQRSYVARIAEHISKPLRREYEGITHEPLPERWVDLINYLNQQEEERRRAVTPSYPRERPLVH